MSGWTPARVRTLQKLRAKPLSIAACARVLGVSKNAATGKLDRLAGRTRTRKPATTAAAPFDRPEPAWWAQARDLRRDGWTVEAIAEELDHDPRSVRRALKTGERRPDARATSNSTHSEGAR